MIEWRDVVGFEGLYEVSSDGRVRGLKRGRVLALAVHRDGHPFQRLCKDGQMSNHYVHRLMAEAFLGPSDLPQVRHLNDVKTDNRVENIAWGTASQNTLDAVRNGVHPNTRKQRCRNGHPYDYSRIDATTGRSKRQCKTCTKARRNDRESRKTEA